MTRRPSSCGCWPRIATAIPPPCGRGRLSCSTIRPSRPRWRRWPSGCWGWRCTSSASPRTLPVTCAGRPGWPPRPAMRRPRRWRAPVSPSRCSAWGGPLRRTARSPWPTSGRRRRPGAGSTSCTRWSSSAWASWTTPWTATAGPCPAFAATVTSTAWPGRCSTRAPCVPTRETPMRRWPTSPRSRRSPGGWGCRCWWPWRPTTPASRWAAGARWGTRWAPSTAPRPPTASWATRPGWWRCWRRTGAMCCCRWGWRTTPAPRPRAGGGRAGRRGRGAPGRGPPAARPGVPGRG